MINEKGEEVGIIYGWCNIKNEKWYVGQTMNQERRFKDHIDAAINKKDNTHFHRAIRKYGLENFVYCVLEENVLRENLNMREMDWIEYYDSLYCGYNMTAGGNQTIFSEEFKRKLSESHKDIHPTEETRRKLSESHKGQTPWNKGKTNIYSEETRNKISNTLKGRHISKEIKTKISEKLKGHIGYFKGKPAPNRKKVSQYDLNGNYIQTFNSLKEAQEKTNIAKSSICTVCQGKRRQSGGFIWKYAS